MTAPAAAPSYLVSSIQLGKPRGFVTPGGLKWRSAIDKQPALGVLAVGREGLVGDAQVDRRFHGGPERALLGYCAEHYIQWRIELGRPQLGPGAFGENLTIAGLWEEEACIGDSFALGTCELQLSQPRVPCVKLARRLELPDAVERTLTTSRTGYYLRVLREGVVEAGQRLQLLARPFPSLTVAFALSQLWAPLSAREPRVAALQSCPLLSDDFRGAVTKSVARAARVH